MRLNGWHRLWIVGVVVWALMIAAYTIAIYIQVPSDFEADLIKSAALIWLLTSVGALIVGYGLAWALRGFRQKEQQ